MANHINDNASSVAENIIIPANEFLYANALDEPLNYSVHVNQPNEPSNDSVNVNTEDNQASTSGITHFEAIKKPNWKGRTMKEELDSDSESSHAPTDFYTSDHSTDLANPSVDCDVTSAVARGR